LKVWKMAGVARPKRLLAAPPPGPSEVSRQDWRLCNELLDGEIFHSLAGAGFGIKDLPYHCSAVRPNSLQGWLPPAAAVFASAMARRVVAQPDPVLPPALASRPSMH
jgi:putative transposase